MTREVAQYRYGVTGLADTITLNQLVQGNKADSPLCDKSIIQLGILGYSGLRFFLNDADADGIVIDSNNIYELNVDGITIITSITFDRNTIRQADTGHIIIDIVYEAEEGIA